MPIRQFGVNNVGKNESRIGIGVVCYLIAEISGVKPYAIFGFSDFILISIPAFIR